MGRRSLSSTPCAPGASDGRPTSRRTSSRARVASSTKRSTSWTSCREPQCCAVARSMSVEKRVRAYLELAAKDADAADLLLAGGNRYSAYHLQQAIEKVTKELLLARV